MMKKDMYLILGIIALGIIGGLYMRLVDYSLITSCTIFPVAPFEENTNWFTFYMYTKGNLFILSCIQFVLAVILVSDKSERNYRLAIQCTWFVAIASLCFLFIYGSAVSTNENNLKVIYTLTNLIYFQSPIISILLYLPLLCTVNTKFNN